MPVLMKSIEAFTLVQHQGPYESWPLETEVFQGGNVTGRKLPGYVLEAQLKVGALYLFVTSWDCLFEESLEIILTDSDLHILDRKSIGAIFTSTWLESYEVTDTNELLLYCSESRCFFITMRFRRLHLKKAVEGDCSPDCPEPGSRIPAIRKLPAWWKFW